ncbi:alpha/beta fold hydrolase [Streptomyces celluloflavus]|uniref:alpha/beta fold hydrolase n=1 Tax=Streptomyces celluloflavus TaxID=58344 RepID=UPI003689ECCB
MSHPQSTNRPGTPDGEPANDGTPPIGRRHDLGGRRLLIHRTGSGGPSVVFVPGAGMVGFDYLNLHDQVSERTTSVLYDRAGTGWSDPVPLPRTGAEVTDELRELLHSAGVPAPYILVGHSLGGSYVRRYAQRFPAEVAGLLLLDPTHEDSVTRMSKQVLEMLERLNDQPPPEPTEEELQQFRGLFAPRLAQWPEAVREALIAHHLAHWRTGAQEGANLVQLGEEVRHGGDLPDVPVIVLTAMGRDMFQAVQLSEEVEREFCDVKYALHAELAAAAPRGEHRVLDDAGHAWLHVERPDAVHRAITDLLDSVGG